MDGTYHAPTFNYDGSVDVTVKSAQGTTLGSKSLTLNGTKLLKKVILRRTTYDLNYIGNIKDKEFTGDLLLKPNANVPEILEIESTDANELVLDLQLRPYRNIQDYRVTANNQVVSAAKTSDNNFRYTINLEDQITFINIECPYNASQSGTFENTTDGRYIYQCKWRQQEEV